MQSPVGVLMLDMHIEKALANYVTIPEDVPLKGQWFRVEPRYSVCLAFHVGDT